jgi:EAL domain-containing protein (putative c-di-GMP-specific phosphodiesterase class I)
MAQALELDVVAEGIETADQAQGLTALECTYGQGFHFARPMRADAMTEYLAGHPPVSAWRRRAPVVGVSAPPAR